MCTQLKTTMACGCSFVATNVETSTNGSNSSSPRSNSNSPGSNSSSPRSNTTTTSGIPGLGTRCTTNCSSPEMRYQFIYDTCAKCDPEARRRLVRQEYDYRHQELFRRYLVAKEEGDGTAMRRLEGLMMENTLMTRERNFEVGQVRRDLDVRFNSTWEDYRK